MEHNLTYLKLDHDWLFLHLSACNLSEDDLKDITLAVYNQQGLLEVDTNRKKEKTNNPYDYHPGTEN